MTKAELTEADVPVQAGGEADTAASVATAQAPPAAAAPSATEKTRRPALARLFAISPWGAFKLLLLCILVGMIVMAAKFDPRNPQVDLGAMTSSLARDVWNSAVWMARNFWRPALAGAGIVVPVWVLWRLVSLPFRK